MDQLQQQQSLGFAYTIERELGRGGMATVYLARDEKHERHVAVKVLHADLAAVLGAERFLQEIRVLAALQHPHILGLIDSGLFGSDAEELAGRPYYVMPFVDGESLRQRLEREQQLPLGDAVRIASEVASALDYAHRQGVVHRDIKPENILLHDGRALVADFGIALALSTAGGQRMTQTGLSLGTPQYMSPEQAMGEKAITARSDIWALGAVTYEMLTGEPPFTGPTVQAIVARLVAEEPRPITVQRRSVPAHLEHAVLRALEKVPADRWGTAGEFASALQTSAFSGLTSGARPAVEASVPRWRRALPWTIACASTVAFAWTTASGARRQPPPLIRSELSFGDSASLATAEPLIKGDFAVLPGDSLLVAVRAGEDAGSGLLLAHLTTGEVTLLPNTSDARFISTSPDGHSIAFVARSQLWKASVAGGEPISLGRVRAPTCTAWGTGDRILVCEDEGASLTLFPVGGGTKDTLRNAPRSRLATATSNGRWLIPTAAGVWMDGGREHGVLTKDGLADSASLTRNPDAARDAPAGNWVQQIAEDRIAWVDADRRLVVASFDPKSGRVGEHPILLADSVNEASFGTRGVLALARGQAAQQGVIVIADRKGHLDTLPYPLAAYRAFDVSPDGHRVAVVVEKGSSYELRLLDVDHPASRMLPVPGAHEPRWSPDGKRIAVEAHRYEKSAMLVVVDPDEAQHVDTVVRGAFIPHAWSPDGKEIAGSLMKGNTYGQLSRIRPGTETAPRRVPGLSDNDWYQSYSPDGRWYVFEGVSEHPDETGVYLVENRAGATPTLVAAGMDDPQWSADGREVIVLCRPSLCSIPVSPGPVPVFGKPARIAGTQRVIDFAGTDLHVLRDGRVAFLQEPPVQPQRGLTLISDWRAEYARRTTTTAR